uniref:Cytoplasmic tRNA 2-thiolation protein 2 n=1 Tax=Dicentrarchus labrax TaxID=13489 RepID=A0A8P4G359_DICLA
MCQVDEDYREELESAHVPSVSKKCVKCKEATAAVVIRVGDTYCRGCFKEYFIHKFRAMLGKNRIIFPGEKVLLAVSGGPSSCSMLSQVQEGLSQNAHKKLRFLPGIVYIDEGSAVGQSVEERRKTADELQAVFKATGFPFHIVPLEQVLDLPSSVVVMAPSPAERPASAYKAAVDHFIQRDSSNCLTQREVEETSLLDVQESHTQSLQQLIGSAKTLTAVTGYVNIELVFEAAVLICGELPLILTQLCSPQRQHLLVHTARSEGYSKVMLGDNCTRLAVKLLSSISLGRGAQLAQDTGFSDSRYGDIILVRPMRDYSAKEIAYYNHMFNVPSVFIPSLETKTTDKASIQRLTESFVTKLQADFPSTVSTIYRSWTPCAVKTSGLAGTDALLPSLLRSVFSYPEDASAFKATLISEQLSQTKSPQATSTEILRQNPGTMNIFHLCSCPLLCLCGNQ